MAAPPSSAGDAESEGWVIVVGERTSATARRGTTAVAVRRRAWKHVRDICRGSWTVAVVFDGQVLCYTYWPVSRRGPQELA